MGDTLTRDQRYNRSEKGRARWQRYNRKRTARPDNAKRVFVGGLYVGMTHTPEGASIINEAVRKEQRDRKKQSRA